MSSQSLRDPGPSRPRTDTVLLVDDDAKQLKLGRLRLIDAGFQVETASGADDALEKARRLLPDAILSDVLMDELDGFGLCHRLRADPSLAEVPVILLSAHYYSDPDQELAMRVGAVALVAKTPDFDAELAALRRALAGQHPDRLDTPAADLYERRLRTNAHQIAKLLGQTRSAEERYRMLFAIAHDLISLLTPEGVVLEVNGRCQELLGWAPEEVIGRHIREFAAPGHEETNLELYRSSLDGRRALPAVMQRRDGATIYVEFTTTTFELEGRLTVLSIGRDATEQVAAAARLARAEERYRSLVERIPDVIWTATAAGRVTFATPNVKAVLGYSADETRRFTPEERAQQIHPNDRSAVVAQLRTFFEEGKAFDVEYRAQHKDGHWLWVRNRVIASYERDGVGYIDGMLTDVNERKRLEEGLRLSQKMEAIGQLTGGIAHDFNNLIAAVLAHGHFLMTDLAEHDPRRADAEAITAAAERAAGLTRQLLAFSRRQVLEARVVDLDAVVEGLEKMLRRLIGEDIAFSVVPGDDVGAVRVDVGQLEQVVMNLVVNARDAMPTGGALTIATSGVDLDVDAAAFIGAKPGRYAVVAVSDTGCGMDAATRQRIFEPFFTTKELGKGTGLGLSTCYGIVKQSGGYIQVESELGHGALFKVFLPRADARPTVQRARPDVRRFSGSETLLVIEDEESVRTVVGRMLGLRGYRLLMAKNGSEALEIARCHGADIDLILSDVILPGGSGPEVVVEVQAHARKARALFMSGYSDHAILRNEALRPGVNFIQKPFAPDMLARKVREVLDAGGRRFASS